MTFLIAVFHWFTAAAHWHGTDGIPHRLFEHLAMSGAATLVAAGFALPVGIGLGHVGRGGALAVNITNVGRAIPSFALLVIALELFGIGAPPAFITLVALAVPPIITNAYAGLRGVDDDLRDAARGMGMTGAQSLFQVELPVALPLVLGGVRTAAVQVVATATLAALVAWGGLGRYIVDGIAQRDDTKVFAGALLVALVAAGTELSLGMLQRALTPRGLRARGDLVKNEPFAGPADVLAPAPALGA